MRTGAKAFTLIELLVVVAIIALLVSILLPSLGKARDLTRNVMCLSNQRHLVTAMTMYSTDGGMYPPCPSWQNASNNCQLYADYDTSSARYEIDNNKNGKRGYMKPGWFAMGLCYGLDYIDNPESYYCPAIDNDHPKFTYPRGWNLDDPEHSPGWRYTSYIYRIFGQVRNPPTLADVEELHRLEQNAGEVLFADMFIAGHVAYGNPYIYEPQHMDPYGLNAAFADGHAEFVKLGEDEYWRVRYAGSYDEFAWLYMRALGTGDFTPVDAAGY